MEVTELALTPTDTLPSARQYKLAATRPRINNIIHVVVTPHKCLLVTEIKVTDTLHRSFDILHLFFLT